MTDQQLAERIAKLENINAAEIGCRAGELLNLLREIKDLRAEVDEGEYHHPTLPGNAIGAREGCNCLGCQIMRGIDKPDRHEAEVMQRKIPIAIEYTVAVMGDERLLLRGNEEAALAAANAFRELLAARETIEMERQCAMERSERD